MPGELSVDPDRDRGSAEPAALRAHMGEARRRQSFRSTKRIPPTIT